MEKTRQWHRMQTPHRSWPPHTARRTDPASNADQSRWNASSDEPYTDMNDHNVPTEPLTSVRSPAAFSSPPRWPRTQRGEKAAPRWNSFTLLFAATTVACVLVIILAVVVV